jgi:hypothetical protein
MTNGEESKFRRGFRRDDRRRAELILDKLGMTNGEENKFRRGFRRDDRCQAELILDKLGMADVSLSPCPSPRVLFS